MVKNVLFIILILFQIISVISGQKCKANTKLTTKKSVKSVKLPKPSFYEADPFNEDFMCDQNFKVILVE